jgi:hypothetical protein
MKQGLLANLGRVLAFCLLLTLAAAAQTAQSGPPVKLSLRVAIGARGVPSFYPLSDEEGKGAGASYGIRPLPSARLLSGPPVDTVTVSFVREGNGARVNVYAHRGSGENRESLKVAECVLGEWQECEATQLAAYGVEPFRLSVVRRVEVELTPPRVNNRTQAVVVDDIKIHAEVPSFELVLRNASEKEVRAVEVEEYRGMMPKGAPPMYNWKRTPVIKPGKTLSVTLEFGWNGKATPEGHAVEPPDRVEIKSVLFADGTYEGSSLFAARAEAYREGRRIQLGRVAEMLRELEAAPVDYASLQGLAQRVELLETFADWTAVNAFGERYHVANGEELERLKSLIESGMQLQRAAALAELNVFLGHPIQASDPVWAQRWVKAMRERYEILLAGV